MRAAIDAARAVDPEGIEVFEAALAAVEGSGKLDPVKVVLTQAETARLLGCSRWTVRNLVRDESLNPVAIRGRLKFRRDDVLALVGGKAGGAA